MQNFTYSLPTKIVFGKGVVKNLGVEVKNYGKKVLLVYGKNSIKKNGIYQQVLDQLQQQNIEIIEHEGVSPNPKLSHVRQGIKKAKENSVDLILAVGGGSVIDESKAIAGGTLANFDIWEAFLNNQKITKALPIITVLTIPAAGSETNFGTVITNDENNYKTGYASPYLSPKVSFMDPEYTYTLTENQLAYASSDIMSHLLEIYFTSQETFAPVQYNYIEGLIKALIESVKAIQKDEKNYEARASFMWCASMAWNWLSVIGLKGAGLYCHSIEHPLSGIYDIAHGAGLSIITPAWLRFNKEKFSEKLKVFSKNIFNGEPDSETAIKNLELWYKEIKTPTTFKQAGIENPDINAMAKQAYDLLELKDIDDYTEQDIKKIYQASL